MVWSRTVGSALTTGGLVAEPGVDLSGDVWLGDDFGSDSVLICGVCIGCASDECDMVRDEAVSWPEPVDFVRLLDLRSETSRSVLCLRYFQLESFIAGSNTSIYVPLLCPSGPIAPAYSSGDLVRLVPRGLGCDSRFGAIVEAADEH